LALVAALPALVWLWDANAPETQTAAGVNDRRLLAPPRLAHAEWVAAAACLLMIAPLLYLGRHLTFFADDWTFIVERHFSGLAGWLAPHNEHWSTVLLLIYHALLAVVGLDRKSTRLNSSHRTISYAVFCLKKKKT